MNTVVGYSSGFLSGVISGGALALLISKFFDSAENDADFCDEEDLGTGYSDSNPENMCMCQNQERNIIHLELTDATIAEFLRSSSQTRTPNIKDPDFWPFGTFKTDCDECDFGEGEIPVSAVEKSVSKKSTVETPVGQPNKNSMDIDEDEMTGIFEEHHNAQKKSIPDILETGKELERQKVSFPSSGCGYVTMSQLEEIKKKHTETKNKTLTRSEELDIIHAFRGIIGLDWVTASLEVGSQGYKLHPIYFGNGNKNPANNYSATTLGVRVEASPNDNYFGIPDPKSKILEIIDVGGIDAKNRG